VIIVKNNSYIGVIIPAAGSGARMGGVYKPLEKLCGREMICYSLDTFEKCGQTAFVVISAREDKISEIQSLWLRWNPFARIINEFGAFSVSGYNALFDAKNLLIINFSSTRAIGAGLCDLLPK
jgi:GTP:adenosylcobinamide-phosphate guanylyltransferase